MTFTFDVSSDTCTSVRQVLLSRGAVPDDSNPTHSHSVCSLRWTTKRTKPVKQRETSSSSLPGTIHVNHFPHTRTLTEKAGLARTIRRMRSVYGSVYDYAPMSFILPSQLAQAYKAEEQREREGQDTLWIVKPSCSSQGCGIRLLPSLSAFTSVSLPRNQPYVLQQYLSHPHLLDGYKYDLRIYVLVRSVFPLSVYLCEQGLCRCSAQPYDLSDLDNHFSHLTNSSINKRAADYYSTDKHSIGKGSKWTLTQWIQYMTQTHAKFNRDTFLTQLSHISLLTVLPLVMEDNQADSQHESPFEVFGLDVLVDHKLKLWLMEVNKSPSLSIAGEQDKQVKLTMLNDLFTLLDIRGETDNAEHKQAQYLSQVDVERQRTKIKLLRHSVSRSASSISSVSASPALSPNSPASPVASTPRSSSYRQQLTAQSVGCWRPLFPATLSDQVLNELLSGSKPSPVQLSAFCRGVVARVKQSQAAEKKKKLHSNNVEEKL